MRSVETIYRLICEVATQCDNVRLVVLNGSRANKETVLDQLQDFDIVYYVRDLSLVPNDNKWLDVFGERLIMQTLDDMIFDPPKVFDGLVYLMQFTDGNRIDLTIRELEYLDKDLNEDSLSKIILDKDHLAPHNIPDESSYFVQKPTEALYHSCINELLWVSLYVVKGIIRNEYVYAHDHLNIMRNCLKGLLNWYIGHHHDYQVNVGKHCKSYEKLLPSSYYVRFIESYRSATCEEIIEGLYTILDFANEIALKVSVYNHFDYDINEYEKVLEFIHRQFEQFEV